MASMDDAQKQNPETRKLMAEMAKNTLTSPRANNYKPPAPSPKTPVANTSQENFVSHVLSMFWGAEILLLGYIHPRFFVKPMQFHQEKFSHAAVMNTFCDLVIQQKAASLLFKIIQNIPPHQKKLWSSRRGETKWCV